MTTKLFTLKSKSKSKDDICRARGCKLNAIGEFPGDLWREFPIRLCEQHAEEAAAFAEAHPNYEPPQVWSPQERAELAQLQVVSDEVAIKRREATDVTEIVRAYKIETQADLERVNEWLQWAVKRRKEIALRKESIVAPIRLAISRLQSLFGPVEKSWADAELLLRDKIRRHALVESERTEAAMDIAAEAAAAGDEAVATAVLATVTNVSELPGTRVEFIWDVEVVDIEQLPAEYVIKKADVSALKIYAREQQKLGKVPEVPGVKFVKDARTIVRTAN